MSEREEKPLREQLRKATEEKEQLREKVLIWQIIERTENAQAI